MHIPDPSFDARIVELQPQPSVAFRLRIPMAELDLSQVFDRTPEILERLAATGGTPSGPMYGRYHEFGPEWVDVEAGYPVARVPDAIPALGSVQPGEIGHSELPGGAVATTTHRGSYEGLPSVYDRLHDWIHGQGREDGAGPWESYVDSPATVADERDLRTEVTWPLG